MPIILWLLGVPLSLIIVLALFGVFWAGRITLNADSDQ